VRQAGIAWRRQDERVAVCVPTRNVETWVRALCCPDLPVNETDDYKRDVTFDDVRDAVARWLSQAAQCDLPSYLDARAELRRLSS
jgi:hypothetical protein